MSLIDLCFGMKYGNWTYTGDRLQIGKFSQKKLLFRCTCGKEKSVRLVSVTLGRSISCGSCSSIELKNGDVYMSFIYIGETISVLPNSEKKIPFRCQCGKIKLMYMFGITTGHTKTCGECRNVDLKNGQKFGDLTYTGADLSIGPGSHRKIQFLCACGKRKNISASSVLSFKAQRKCGDCSLVLLEHGQKYKTFVYEGPTQTVGLWSKKKFTFKCVCGYIKNIPIFGITNGDHTSCGKCFSKAYGWYKKNEQVLKNLKGHVEVKKFPTGGIVPVENINGVVKGFRAICMICDQEYRPALNDIKRGRCITCGCTTKRISVPNQEILSFTESLELNSELEYDIAGKSYDVAIPSQKLVIELNGIRWHSKTDSKLRDKEKYEHAKSHGYDEIMIFEDEWKLKKRIIQNIIQNKLGKSMPTIILRPNKCQVSRVQSQEIIGIYDEFHYLGWCPSKYHYAVIYDGSIVGCTSFRRPSRQTVNHDFEISRMIMNPNYRIHGIWTKILKIFINEHKPKSIVTYSDNRFFNGKTYEKMGFSYDGVVAQDYYWVKGGNRYHKSGLRKPPGYTGTESSLREQESFQKIWDLGKKRWVLYC